jgi:hypothetical protein
MSSNETVTTSSSANLTPTSSSLINTALEFIKHPGTGTAFGITLAALAQFTAAVPVKDRTAPTLIGLGYAVAVQVIDWAKISSK